MRSAVGATVVAVAAFLVCCSADSHQDQDVSGIEHTGERFEAADHKSRLLDPLSGNNLVRAVREAHRSGYIPFLVSRRYDFGSPYGGRRDSWPLVPVEYRGYSGDGLPKRNFDEIDRSSLDTFVKKRNFDEIDRSSMPFPYAIKRFYHSYNFDKKMFRQGKGDMDEIDLSGLPIGDQRPNQDSFLLPRNIL